MTTSPRMSTRSKHAVDGIAGRRIGELLLAAAEPVDGVDGGIFRRADELELDGPLRVVRRQRELAVRHRWQPVLT